LATLQADGAPGARLYGADEADGVGGMGAFFLLLDEPEAYGLPPDPVVTTRDLPAMWRAAGAAAAALAGLVAASVLGGRRWPASRNGTRSRCNRTTHAPGADPVRA